MGLTGEQKWCQCGGVIAGINLATSSTSTTSYCATGGGVPLGFTQIAADGSGNPVATGAPQGTGSGQCDDGSTVDEKCFNDLDLPDYLTKWWSDNQGKCAGLTFANCFYKVQTKYSPSNCSQINIESNCDQPKWDDFKGTGNAAQNFYVAWNIYQTNGFFTDMWTAIGSGEQSAQAALGQTIALLKPPEKTNVLLNDILMALTFALALYAEGTIAMKALIRTAPGSATLFGKIFPEGVIDKQVATWQDVADSLGTVTKAWQDSMAEGLPILQDDVQQFVKWSQESGLSGNRPSLNALSNDMAKALTAYGTSKAIADLVVTSARRLKQYSAGIVVVRAPDVDIHALQNSGTKLTWDTHCQDDYQSGLCGDGYFYDGKDTYALTDPEHQTHSYKDVLEKLLTGDSPKTDGKLLFTSAFDCIARMGKNGNNEPKIDPQNPEALSCLSTAAVCTWKMDGFGPLVEDDTCKNLPNKQATLPRFGISGCIGHTESTTSEDVPKVYMGPGLWADNKGITDLEVYDWCNNIDV
ncbi:uncharacterized protein KY384_002455 [Bacidia gigantensis]|uniref:uncharacterized protein n=1 Tax=Bacidia gigantensis TaxID=2732470 RepID=UPI001D047B61|nr:uncharacterized protein KY384_002455 [Bacidia gigantensis]KAG8532578.1 hypothetical protein KY384_002455 [Bacidia gigantensis]